MFMRLIDYSKAFDTVKTSICFLLYILEFLKTQSDTTESLVNQLTLSKGFWGCVLFSLYTEMIMRSIKGKGGSIISGNVVVVWA